MMRRHTPVLFKEVLDNLPDQCHFVMDGTLWHAWHTAWIVKYLEEKNTSTEHQCAIVWVDRDRNMIQKAKHFLSEASLLGHVHIVQWSYAALEHISQVSNVKNFDMILLDIWVNMDHFKEADRGFSIKLDGSLDMRYDRSYGVPAADVLAKISYDDFCTMLEKWTDFGQKYREWLVKEYLWARKKSLFITTQQLRVWAKEIGVNDKKLAVLFQAIRIEVNNELWELEMFLQLFPNFLIERGRCMIITYHSIEDRIVKYAFKNLVQQWYGALVNKKVIKPHRQEVQKNKAARSAKLRIFERT